MFKNYMLNEHINEYALFFPLDKDWTPCYKMAYTACPAYDTISAESLPDFPNLCYCSQHLQLNTNV